MKKHTTKLKIYLIRHGEKDEEKKISIKKRS